MQLRADRLQSRDRCLQQPGNGPGAPDKAGQQMAWKLLRVLAGLAAGLLGTVAIAADPAPGNQDLETWVRLGAPVWRFDPTGTEAGPGTDSSFLVSPGAFADFDLSVEFWIEDATNSGILVRCGPVEVIDDINPVDCYEANIFDSHPNPSWRTGAIVTRVEPAATVDTLARWNRMEVRARGARIEVRVNDILTASLDDAAERSGPIALQYAGTGLLRFRRLTIGP
jgi:3-keto-disaccharide hydrolase